ncbi:MAG: hypothetical protein QOI43_2235 [Gaiellales bacterium]|nr:hypothetical protein [Gaiellales bacterium]
MAMPKIEREAEWQDARAAQLVKEKAATRALDALAAERRRLPMVRIDKDYVFEGLDGDVRLADIFEGRRQLLIYHFMFGPGEQEPCAGCSSFTDNVGNLSHLHARDTTYALMSRAPLDELLEYEQRMGWDLPWYSSFGNDFNRDFGLTTDAGETFGLHAYLRDGDDVFLTYRTNARGVDRLRLDFNLLDLTPYGRQEEWEDSPEGWPQTPAYRWWRRHDEYPSGVA